MAKIRLQLSAYKNMLKQHRQQVTIQQENKLKINIVCHRNLAAAKGEKRWKMQPGNHKRKRRQKKKKIDK